jgi:hypothetical protein
VSYVDAGYASALGVLFLYGIGIVLRRRRWERALEHTELDEGAPGSTPGGQP